MKVSYTSKKVVAFSLYGSRPMYWLGLLNNIRVLPTVMPGWTPMVYIEEDHFLIPILLDLGVDYEICPNDLGGTFGSTWRFYALARPDFDYVVCRDTDSLITSRDAWAVSQWVKSGKPIHVIRDFPTKFPVCAGCFGAKGGMFPTIQQDIHAFITNHGTAYTCDEAFLREYIWERYKDSCLIHGDGGIPFPSSLPRTIYFTGFKLNPHLLDVFNWNPYMEEAVCL